MKKTNTAAEAGDYLSGAGLRQHRVRRPTA